MEHHLTFTTDSMDVCINNYEPYSFDYKGWTVSDKYVHNKNNPRGSSYAIIFSSPLFSDEEELNNYRLSGQDISNLITTLIPVCGLPSLNSPKFMDFLKDQYIIDYKSTPQGWSTNYSEMLEVFEEAKQSKIRVNVNFVGICRYAVIDSSPLKDLEHLLNAYDDSSEEVKFLLFLNYSILTSNDLNAFMLIAKALEIINVMYPFKHNHGKADERVKNYFPELVEIFKDITIKDLWTYSNTRKETRHFPNNKNNNLPHESLTKEERINMYKCTTCLLVNVLRDKFGLPHNEIVFCKQDNAL